VPKRSRFAFLTDNAYLLLALTSLFWSGNHIVGRAVAGHAPPFGISIARWLFAALILWPLARPHLARDWPLIKRDWRIILFLGLTGGAVFSALQYLGLQYTTALNTSVLNSLGPVLIAGAGALAFRDQLTPPQMIGIATSLIGVLVIVTRADLLVLTELRFNEGDVIIVINQVVFAVYSAYLRRRPAIHWLSFLFSLAVISVVTTAPFFAWEHASGLTFQPTLLTAFSLAYVAIFPSLLAFAAWNRGVEKIGANRSGAFLHLIPIYSAILAYVFLGERPMAYHALGFALILAGVWLTARRASAAQPRPPATAGMAARDRGSAG
jgi:drug/metabolite transporter (DMT)-like permease